MLFGLVLLSGLLLADGVQSRVHITKAVIQGEPGSSATISCQGRIDPYEENMAFYKLETERNESIYQMLTFWDHIEPRHVGHYTVEVGRSQHDISLAVYSLTIRTLAYTDDGYYMCAIVQQTTKKILNSAIAELIVLHPVQALTLQIGTSRFSSDNVVENIFTADVFRPTTISCEADGSNPEPNMQIRIGRSNASSRAQGTDTVNVIGTFPNQARLHTYRMQLALIESDVGKDIECVASVAGLVNQAVTVAARVVVVSDTANTTEPYSGTTTESVQSRVHITKAVIQGEPGSSATISCQSRIDPYEESMAFYKLVTERNDSIDEMLTFLNRVAPRHVSHYTVEVGRSQHDRFLAVYNLTIRTLVDTDNGYYMCAIVQQMTKKILSSAIAELIVLRHTSTTVEPRDTSTSVESAESCDDELLLIEKRRLAIDAPRLDVERERLMVDQGHLTLERERFVVEQARLTLERERFVVEKQQRIVLDKIKNAIQRGYKLWSNLARTDNLWGFKVRH